MNIQLEENQIYCPISKCIFLDPVLTCDGFTYERILINKWLHSNNISPVTGLPLDNKQVIDNILMRQLVSKCLLNDKNLLNEQFNDFDVCSLINNFDKYKIKIDKINTIDLSELIEISNIDDKFKYILKTQENIYIFKFINKIKNLECIIDRTLNLKLIHLLCKYSNDSNVIKYLIDKNIDLECKTNDKWKPIHLLCKYSNDSNVIKYLIDKNIDLECKTNKLIDILCNKNMLEILQYLINKHDKNNKNGKQQFRIKKYMDKQKLYNSYSISKLYKILYELKINIENIKSLYTHNININNNLISKDNIINFYL